MSPRAFFLLSFRSQSFYVPPSCLSSISRRCCYRVRGLQVTCSVPRVSSAGTATELLHVSQSLVGPQLTFQRHLCSSPCSGRPSCAPARRLCSDRSLVDVCSLWGGSARVCSSPRSRSSPSSPHRPRLGRAHSRTTQARPQPTKETQQEEGSLGRSMRSSPPLVSLQ